MAGADGVVFFEAGGIALALFPPDTSLQKMPGSLRTIEYDVPETNW
jgi:hypothetical protein